MCLVRMLTFALVATIGLPSMAQEKLFSAPQPGEKLTGFKVRNYKLQGPLSLLADADASDEDVDRHVATIEALVKQDEAAGKELGGVTSRLLSTGMLSKRGTKPAQEHFKQWAKQYGGSVSP